MNENQVLDKVYNMVVASNYELYKTWLEQIVFSWRWWLGLTLSIVPWIIWYLYREKKSTSRLLHSGLIVIIIASYLDFIGTCNGLWHYDWVLIPTVPAYLPWDITLLPVSIMMIIQYRPDIKPVYKAIAFALFTAFIAETIFEWLSLYDPKGWKHIYSFPLYVIIYLIADYMGKRKSFTMMPDRN